MLIDSGDGGGGGGEDAGKLTRKRLNRGLPGRKQGIVRIQVANIRVPSDSTSPFLGPAL